MEFTKTPYRKTWLWAKLIFFVAVPLVLLILPATFFDDGPPMCLSVILLKTECLGCGMTRGIMHLIHFEFNEAAYYNVGSFVVFPVLAFLWAKWFLAVLKEVRFKVVQNSSK